MVDDQKLSDNFSLYELTQTSHLEFQEMNRKIDDLQIGKLRNLALLLENVRIFLGVPLVVSSGYRCPALNSAVGSGMTSQHLLCEAADVVPKGMAVDEAFKKLRQCVKDRKLEIGQLIFEKANRGYATEWCHISLGAPYRVPEKCGQVLTMIDGNYTLLEQVTQD